MKKITCDEIGGPCEAVITAKNVKELLHNGFIHAKKYHPTVIKQLNKEDGKDWQEEIQKKWEIASAV